MTNKEKAQKLYSIYEGIRNEKGLTDYAVAEKAGFVPSTLYDWRDGRYAPKIDKMIAIAKALDVPVDQLVGGLS